MNKKWEDIDFQFSKITKPNMNGGGGGGGLMGSSDDSYQIGSCLKFLIPLIPSPAYHEGENAGASAVRNSISNTYNPKKFSTRAITTTKNG